MITLVHLYPREMNIYGDTGNVIVLKRRLQWRGFDVRVVPINIGDPLPHDADILLGGGGQDAAQGEHPAHHFRDAEKAVVVHQKG